MNGEGRTPMRVVVVGLGSMGRRRIRLLGRRADVASIVGVDARPDRRREAGVPAFADLGEALASGPDCAFVCTSPLAHAGIVTACLEAGAHVFTELNLVADGYGRNMELAGRRGRVLFLSSTLLYREEIRHIRRRVAAHPGSLSYVYHVGQYLPDWHPWEAYNDFFVGDRRTNGCRELLAIELPWILAAFGPVASLHSSHRKRSALDIDYDDSYLVTLEHGSGHAGVVAVDVLSPKPVRNLEIVGERFYVGWNGTPDTLHEYADGGVRQVRPYGEVEHADGYQATVVENAYAAEIDAFMRAVATGEAPGYGFGEDLVTLRLVDDIEGTR